MARTKNNERSANRVAVDVGATGTRPASKGAVATLAVCVLAALWAVSMMLPAGRVGYLFFFIYAEYYFGVIALVALSITIMVGLVATDRMVLSIRQRVMLQSTHRTTGVIAVSALVVHVWTKVVDTHLPIGVIDAFIPFLAPYNRVPIGFGTLSGWIMILVMWTGIARARFIRLDRPWLWRSIHSISYLMWPIALMHGLTAGRAAKPWVIVSYILCILLVLVGLAVRLSVSLNRRKDFSSTATSGIKPVGKLVPTSTAAPKRMSRRDQQRAEADSLGPVAVLDTFRPVAAAPPPPPEEPRPARRFPDEERPAAHPRRPMAQDGFDEPTGMMVARRDLEFDEPAPRGGRRRGDAELEYDEPAPRGRRYPGEDTGTRMRPIAPEDTGTRMRRPDLEDTGTRMRRPELEDTSTRMRRVEMDDTGTRMRPIAPEDTGTRMRRPDLEDTSTRMRRVEMDDTGTRIRPIAPEDTGTRMRRAEMDDTRSFRPDFDDSPAPRQRRYADDEEPAPRARRRAEEPRYDDAPRASRHADQDYEDLPRQRAPRYDEEPPRRSGRLEPRYGEEVDAPRTRRDRGADIDRADSGRHSRSQFIGAEQAEPDETPTLVDMASRRARRDQQEPVSVQAGRGARRGGRGRGNDDATDDGYWSQLRGEAN